jgi:hypothetical protein
MWTGSWAGGCARPPQGRDHAGSHSAPAAVGGPGAGRDIRGGIDRAGADALRECRASYTHARGRSRQPPEPPPRSPSTGASRGAPYAPCPRGRAPHLSTRRPQEWSRGLPSGPAPCTASVRRLVSGHTRPAARRHSSSGVQVRCRGHHILDTYCKPTSLNLSLFVGGQSGQST